MVDRKSLRVAASTIVAAFIAAGCFGAATAQATTYTGLRTIGTSTATLSIETDGTLGLLTTENIISWTIDLFQDGATVQLTSDNSAALIIGDVVRASRQNLFFDFDQDDGQLLFQAGGIGSGDAFYCAQVVQCFDLDGRGEAISTHDDGSFKRHSLFGLVSIASSGAVPEPASWAMMIGGLGIVGASMRRRGVQVRFA